MRTFLIFTATFFVGCGEISDDRSQKAEAAETDASYQLKEEKPTIEDLIALREIVREECSATDEEGAVSTVQSEECTEAIAAYRALAEILLPKAPQPDPDTVKSPDEHRKANTP